MRHSLIDEPGNNALFVRVYDDLKIMARRELRRAQGDTLGTTALVHELYVRLGPRSEWEAGQSLPFFSYAARAMRNILIDRARRRVVLKSRMFEQAVAPDGGPIALDPQQALQLHAALVALEAADPRAAKVVELHYFAGLPLERIAELIGVVRRTVDRDWRYARSFLIAHIE